MSSTTCTTISTRDAFIRHADELQEFVSDHLLNDFPAFAFTPRQWGSDPETQELEYVARMATKADIRRHFRSEDGSGLLYLPSRSTDGRSRCISLAFIQQGPLYLPWDFLLMERITAELRFLELDSLTLMWPGAAQILIPFETPISAAEASRFGDVLYRDWDLVGASRPIIVPRFPERTASGKVSMAPLFGRFFYYDEWPAVFTGDEEHLGEDAIRRILALRPNSIDAFEDALCFI